MNTKTVPSAVLDLLRLLIVTLAIVLHVTPAVAQPHTVTCGAVLDTPGIYELSGDLSCPLLVPPPMFCDVAAITITSPGVRLNGHGFTVFRNPDPAATGVGIRITATRARIQDIAVQGFSVGIEITGGGGHRLTRVASRQNNDFNCGGSGIGLKMTDTSDNVVDLSVFSHNTRWGVRMLTSRHNRLTRSEIADNQFRPGRESGNVDLAASHDNHVSRNNMSGGGLFGLRMVQSDRNLVADNVVNETARFAGFGAAILLSGSSDNDVRRNSVDRELPAVAAPGITGIGLTEGAMRNLIRANTVLHHTFDGILLRTGATENRVRGNRAHDNTPFDATDENPNCDANSWTANQFGTVNQPDCIQ